jgi:hypothetical protein
MKSAMFDQFTTDGFWIARGLCPADRVAAMRDAAESALVRRTPPFELERDVGYPGAPRSSASPGGKTIRRLLDALALAPVFSDWACARELLDPLRTFLRSDSIRVVRAHHNCVMTKLPEFSSSTGWHQDLRYWAFERPELVNAWTALGVEAEGNGGMRVIPGSHRASFDAGVLRRAALLPADLADNREWLDRAVQVDLAARRRAVLPRRAAPRGGCQSNRPPEAVGGVFLPRGRQSTDPGHPLGLARGSRPRSTGGRRAMKLMIAMTAAMMLIVASANVLVQYPVNDWLTWGALTYPISYFVTDLTNRLRGPQAARRVVWAGFALAVLLSAVLATPRIALASGTAFLVSQLLDVRVFDRLRGRAWWQPPLFSSVVGSAVDTALFFALALPAPRCPG